MVKKLFALASVTALTGLMAAVAASGCSSSTPGDATPVTEAGPDAKTPTPKADAEPEPVVDSGPSNCPTTDKVDTSTVKFKTPNPSAVGACVDADFIAMEKAVKGGAQSFDKIIAITGVSAGCQACAYPAATTTWGPIVRGATPADDATNPGGCLAITSGNDACGKAYAELDACRNEVCTDCADTDRSKCFTASTKTKTSPCTPQVTALQTACGAAFTPAATACDNAVKAACTTCSGDKGDVNYQFEVYITQQCGAGAVVAGGG